MKRAYGFTVVELLIVIVVVAILAALSYVGYTNIQARARLSIAQGDAASIKRAMDVYRVDEGHYPYSGGELNSMRLRVTRSAYGPVSGYANLIYCVNTETDEFSFVSMPLGRQGAVQVTSGGGVEVVPAMPNSTGFSSVCGLIGATEETRFVIGALGGGGTWSSWLGE